jgi:hypothetical protein
MMTDESVLLTERSGHLLTLILNRPHRKNAITAGAELTILGPGAATEILCVCHTFDLTRRTAPATLGNRRDPAGRALIDMLLLYMLRTWLDENTDRTTGWATARTDPTIATALHHIHRTFESHWTVEGLA